MRNPSKNTIKKLKRLCNPGTDTIERYTGDINYTNMIVNISGRIFKMSKKRFIFIVETPIYDFGRINHNS